MKAIESPTIGFKFLRKIKAKFKHYNTVLTHKISVCTPLRFSMLTKACSCTNGKQDTGKSLAFLIKSLYPLTQKLDTFCKKNVENSWESYYYQYIESLIYPI